MSIYASLVGTIAQQQAASSGGGGSLTAPTSVTVATSASGNFDNAVIVDCTTGPGVIASNTGSTFSVIGPGDAAGDIDLNFSPFVQSALVGNSGVLNYETFGFCRATGATSFQWALGSAGVVQDTNGAVSSIGVSGSASTAQDRTSSSIGVTVNVTHNSGGRGFLMMSASGDGYLYRVQCTATNSNGSTLCANVVTVRILRP